MNNLQNISIIYEDEDILAIDKPSGMIVNRADTTKNETTVQDWTEKHIGISKLKAKNLRSEAENKPLINTSDGKPQDWEAVNRIAFYERAGIVHRLDKETSGILLIAKNPDAFIELLRQFRERIIKKSYIALVHGKPEQPEGEINVPIGRLPWNRKRFGVVPGGRESVTKYKVISDFKVPGAKSDETLSLLELFPYTGRTHQIRVHLQYIGHPIFSDFLYAGRKTQQEDRQVLSRVFLHAAKIYFLHPKTGREMTLESKLPGELERVIKR